MALIRRDELRRAAQKRESVLAKSADSILTESTKSFSEDKNYTIFLSHSYLDKEEVLGLKETIEELGNSVYVDWLEDPQLDRKNVTSKTADYLRKRMKRCQCLFYAYSESSTQSKWMQWELGYFDAFKTDKVAILPVVDTYKNDFSGTEFLGLYPYVQKAGIQGKNKEALWIYSAQDTYIIFESWLTGGIPTKHV
jgi:hypothetical protein